MTEQMTGAQSLIRSLEAAGTTDIFGIPGGAILPAYDPLMDSSIRHILVRHEQGAGHAAQGYAAATGRVGVCMATSGPGATNLVTPIADALMDSVPIVAVTGQVGRGDRNRRLPGGRHPRHHDADHQAQLPGHDGIRQFTVGTGGNGLYGFRGVKPNSQVRNAKTLGVLKLTLRSGGYDWEFLPQAGKTFTDTGTTACHGRPSSVTPPSTDDDDRARRHPSPSTTTTKPPAPAHDDHQTPAVDDDHDTRQLLRLTTV